MLRLLLTAEELEGGQKSVSRKALDELKQQISLLEYLQAHDWQPAREPPVWCQQGRGLLYSYGSKNNATISRIQKRNPPR